MKTSQRKAIRRGFAPALGQEMPLNRLTPLGLFEAQNQDRFIVCDDTEYGRCAIVLRSHHRPLYSWLALSEKPLLRGRWWGPCRIRLTESYETINESAGVGGIAIMERHIFIGCANGDEDRWMVLGVIADANSEHRDAEGWVIEAARAGFTFCERLSNGRINCAPAPTDPIKDWCNEDFVEVISSWPPR